MCVSRGSPRGKWKVTGSFFLSQCYATEQDCNVPRRFRSTLVPLMSELGWHVQINMKYFGAVSQWQQSLSQISALQYQRGVLCNPGTGDKTPLIALRNIFLGVRPRSQCKLPFLLKTKIKCLMGWEGRKK